jgi:hypothetical protein
MTYDFYSFQGSTLRSSATGLRTGIQWNSESVIVYFRGRGLGAPGAAGSCKSESQS